MNWVWEYLFVYFKANLFVDPIHICNGILWFWISESEFWGSFSEGYDRLTVTWCSLGMLGGFELWAAARGRRGLNYHNLSWHPKPHKPFKLVQSFSFLQVSVTTEHCLTTTHVFWDEFRAGSRFPNSMIFHIYCQKQPLEDTAYMILKNCKLLQCRLDGHLYLEKVPTSSAGWSLSMSGAGFCCLKISRILSQMWSYSNSAPTIAMNIDPTMIATPTWWSRTSQYVMIGLSKQPCIADTI